jgi:hypothetical protein
MPESEAFLMRQQCNLKVDRTLMVEFIRRNHGFREKPDFRQGGLNKNPRKIWENAEFYSSGMTAAFLNVDRREQPSVNIHLNSNT